jgi:hypothetical protein
MTVDPKINEAALALRDAILKLPNDDKSNDVRQRFKVLIFELNKQQLVFGAVGMLAPKGIL